MNDRHGNKVKDGDLLESSYGIPPVKVFGTVAQIDGELWVFTPGHTPSKCKLTSFKKSMGEFEIVKEKP